MRIPSRAYSGDNLKLIMAHYFIHFKNIPNWNRFQYKIAVFTRSYYTPEKLNVEKSMGMSFFTMPSNRGPQRAASNQDHELVEWHWFEAAYRLVLRRAW